MLLINTTVAIAILYKALCWFGEHLNLTQGLPVLVAPVSLSLGEDQTLDLEEGQKSSLHVHCTFARLDTNIETC